MLKYFVVLCLICMTGCATLPEDYSGLSIEQLIQGVARNNKPKIMPSNIKTTETPGIVMTTATYNVVGSYTTGAVLDPIDEGVKFCHDNQAGTLGRESVNNRAVLVCDLEGFYFLAIHYLRKERAGFDTGKTYALFDHIAYFKITDNITAPNVEWISDKYVAFENDTVDIKRALGHEALPAQDLSRVLSKYVNEGT